MLVLMFCKWVFKEIDSEDFSVKSISRKILWNWFHGKNEVKNGAHVFFHYSTFHDVLINFLGFNVWNFWSISSIICWSSHDGSSIGRCSSSHSCHIIDIIRYWTKNLGHSALKTEKLFLQTTIFQILNVLYY